MSISQELWDTFRKLAALEARTEDVVKGLERLESKVDNLIDRLSRVEVQYQALRESLRNEILAEIKAEVAVVKYALSLYSQDRTGDQSGLEAAGRPLLPHKDNTST